MAKINSECTYNKALNEVYKLMQKGEANLTEIDVHKISSIAKAIQYYEKVHYPFPFPKFKRHTDQKTLSERIQNVLKENEHL